MSYSAVASYQKDSDSFSQGFDNLSADFFDQFLTYSFTDNKEPDYSVLLESTFLDRSNSGIHSASTSSSSHENEAKHSIVQTRWDCEPLGTIQDSASFNHPSAQGNNFYAELSGRAAISDGELLSLKRITLLSPKIDAYTHLSLPSSPSPAAAAFSRRKNRVAESLSKTFKKATGSLDKNLRSPIRKSSSSPKMMRNSNQSQNALDFWGQKLALSASKFDFDFQQQTGPLSPPPCARISDASESSTTMRVRDNVPPQRFVRPTDYDTPLSTPILDTQHSRNTSSQQLPLDDMLFPATPQLQHTSVCWSQVPGSSELNAYVTSAICGDEADPPPWWNHAATAPMAQPSPTVFHTNPQLATKSLALQLQNGLAYNANDLSCDSSNISSGLMVQMPGLPAQQSCIVASSPMLTQGHIAATQPQPQYHPSGRLHVRGSSRQPQPSSPIRKSRSGSSGSESQESSPSPAFHVRKRKTHKTNKQSTPRTPTFGGAVDFVNFTPNDSKKILTGVAPSGSSKTKARREKEAMEKRRKFSQAAVRAVRAAGGDVESLVEQGLFV
jgi:hypothetical protein